MKLRRARKEPIKETQMVSLADIAFLIIFFFMLTSTFMHDKLAVSLPFLPRWQRSESPTSVTMDQAGHLYLNGQPVGSSDALETELKGLLAGRSDPKDCEVRFNCDRSLTYKDYRAAYQAISHAGGVIAIVHEVK